MNRYSRLFAAIAVLFVHLSILSLHACVQAQTGSRFLFVLDTSPISHQLGQPIRWDTAYGSIQNLTEDSLFLGASQSYSPQWTVRGIISGRSIMPGPPTKNVIVLAPYETLPMMILLLPFPDYKDTISICYSILSLDDTSDKQQQCIPLYIWRSTGSVAQKELLSNSSRVYPNPFSLSATISLTQEQFAWQFEVIIYDATGHEVTDRFTISLTSGGIRIERQDIAIGTYYYRLRSKASPQSSSIIGAGKFVLR